MKSYAWTVSPRGDVSEEDEKFIKDWLLSKNCQFMYSVEHGSKSGQRHLHFAILTTYQKSLKQMFDQAWLNKKIEDDENWTKDHSVLSVTWFKGNLGVDTDGDWIDYVTKDGPPAFNNLPDDYKDHLKDDVPLEQRRKKRAWTQMHNIEELFTKHKLPFGSWDEVDESLSKLAYSLREIRLPDVARHNGFVLDVYMFLNKIEQGRMDIGLRMAVDRGRKRKRIEFEMGPEEGAHVEWEKMQ